MAADRFLPRALGRISSGRQVPYISILVCATVVSGMVLWSLGELLIIDVTVYSAALLLEFVSLIVLRRKCRMRRGRSGYRSVSGDCWR